MSQRSNGGYGPKEPGGNASEEPEVVLQSETFMWLRAKTDARVALKGFRTMRGPPLFAYSGLFSCTLTRPMQLPNTNSVPLSVSIPRVAPNIFILHRSCQDF